MIYFIGEKVYKKADFYKAVKCSYSSRGVCSHWALCIRNNSSNTFTSRLIIFIFRK